MKTTSWSMSADGSCKVNASVDARAEPSTTSIEKPNGTVGDRLLCSKSKRSSHKRRISRTCLQSCENPVDVMILVPLVDN